MTKTQQFRIRKLLTNSETEKWLKKTQPSRIYVNEEALLELTSSKDGGKAVSIEKMTADGQVLRREASVWKAPERLGKTVVQMYDVFRDACGYKLGDQVSITPLGGMLPEAGSLVFEEQARPPDEQKKGLQGSDVAFWEFAIALKLSEQPEQHVYAGMSVRILLGSERFFTVTSVNGRTTSNARYQHKRSVVRIGQPPEADECRGAGRGTLEVGHVAGLEAQVAKLNDFLMYCTSPVRTKRGEMPCGLVIHGGHGTGKTMMLERLAATGWGNVHRIHFKDRLPEVQERLQSAQDQQPSILLIDQLDRLIDKERSNRNAVTQALCEAFDSLAKEAAAKDKLPLVVVVATCLDMTVDVPQELRDPCRFEQDIYLPLPDADRRRAILGSFGLGLAGGQEQKVAASLGERTHAYTGKDLRRLVNKATAMAKTRLARRGADDEAAHTGQRVDLGADDYEAALRLVRPSAMHDINLKPPPVRWDDIGGQESVKETLRMALRLMTAPKATMLRYMDAPPKGFLLYGPPGCSKTMTAQAMATESGALNFFAVKGAELLNMYVGESERAVRQLFSRAREAAPSMIFFDEIDAIAGQRHGFGQGARSSAAGAATSGSGPNVVTTLLNEMDGFEALGGVLVLAATNRPQTLDPALLRPGRFDELIYVAPPDRAARRALFARQGDKQRWHDDVDFDKLADDSDGYSGAEIKGICHAAGRAAYARVFGAQHEDGLVQGITMADVDKAMAKAQKGITGQMLQAYRDWDEGKGLRDP